jgi:hypothetical protein
MKSGQSLVICLLFAGIAYAADPNSQSTPSPQEQATIIAATQDAALRFSDSLPDFICTQVTRRWVGRVQEASMMSLGKLQPRDPGTVTFDSDVQWKLRDTLTIQLSYSEQKEHYQLLLVNGKKTHQSYESIEGATSYGDFGSALGVLFQASSDAQFTWDHWGLLNGQPMMVFDFKVARANSQWRIGYGSQQIVTGFAGSVSIEPKSDCFKPPTKCAFSSVTTTGTRTCLTFVLIVGTGCCSFLTAGI